MLKNLGAALLTLYCEIAVCVVTGEQPCAKIDKEKKLIEQVAVRFVRRDTHGDFAPFCSGVLTGPDEILTAGHCLINEKTKKLSLKEVYAEVYNPVTGWRERIRVQSARAKYRLTEKGIDLALVKLERNSPGRMSLPMAFAGCDDDSSIIAGFGATDSGEMSEQLNTACYADAKEFNSKNWVALHSIGNHACVGDSGAPVLCKSRGRIAIKAIHNGATDFLGSARPGDTVGECKLAERAFGTRLSSAIDLMHRWRSALEVANGPRSSKTGR